MTVKDFDEKSGKAFDYGKKLESGQYENYPVLSDVERSKGFVRPVYREYKHLKCNGVTKMGLELCETYATNPRYYGSTFCATCKDHYPVGDDGEFIWMENGKETNVKVGA